MFKKKYFKITNKHLKILQMKLITFAFILFFSIGKLSNAEQYNYECELNAWFKNGFDGDFKTKIIKGSHFYPCYYRIDVFNYLSKQKNQFSFLIDLDVVLIRSVIKKIQKLAKKKNGLVNDITDLILPAYGFDRINFEFSLLKADFLSAKGLTFS